MKRIKNTIEFTKIVALYELTRGIEKLIQNIWAKVDKTVDIEKYENDWRIIRMENQEMKR